MHSSAPILYEVNTRAWLRELSAKAGERLTLADVPESEIHDWAERGFTHIWLMGVWQIGPEARRSALDRWQKDWRSEIPSEETDVGGSPFAIQEYSVDERLGKPLDLLMLKERLGRAGLKLILDFVPNHFGIDSTEPERHPARFVQGQEAQAGTFRRMTRLGPRWFAHGGDPYFPPWIDTVQVDYRVAEAQESMASIAQTISMFGDGLRCDMAMLLLPEIFAETWKEFPPAGSHLTSADFWRKTIPKVRMLQPNVELIAEAYWDREAQLQDLGFDYTYNKRVTDYVMRGQIAELSPYLHERGIRFLQHSVHFLENHDEQRAAAMLKPELHKAAAALILFLPGMALLHDGQLEGRKRFAPIQMEKRPREEPDPAIKGFYDGLLQAVQKTELRRGVPELVRIQDSTGVVAVRWTGRNGKVHLAIANIGDENFRCEVRTLLRGHETRVSPVYGTADPELDGTRIEIPKQSAHILSVS